MSVAIFLKLVQVEQTLFALPWVFMTALLTGRLLGVDVPLEMWSLLFLATFCARTAGMSWNRYLDRHIDALNPRTSSRLLPAHLVSEKVVLALAMIATLGFIGVCYAIGILCFQLSLGISLLLGVYPLFKRFSYMCHFVLGWIEFFAPVMASVALIEAVTLASVFLGLALCFMIVGMDLIYSTQDIEFDRKQGVYNLSKVLGKKGAFGLALSLHLVASSFLILSFVSFGVKIVGMIGLLIGITLLFSQYYFLQKNEKLVPKVFFWCNSLVSIVLFIFVCMDVL